MCFFSASKVKTRFKSFRTDYVKLKKKVRQGREKSGSSPKRLTRLQQFKLSRGRFIDQFCRQGASADSQEMGPVSLAHNSYISGIFIKCSFTVVTQFHKSQCLITCFCCALLTDFFPAVAAE